MKITELAMRNYCSVERLVWTPREKVNILFGKNESGKTTILRGIQHGLISDVGIPHESCIRVQNGATDFEIELSFQSGESEFDQRRTSGKGRHTANVIAKKLQVPLDVLKSSLDARQFLSLSDNKQRQILTNLLGLEQTVPVCTNELMAALKREGLKVEDAMAELFALGFEFEETFRANYKSVYQLRVEHGRERDVAQAQLEQWEWVDVKESKETFVAALKDAQTALDNEKAARHGESLNIAVVRARHQKLSQDKKDLAEVLEGRHVSDAFLNKLKGEVSTLETRIKKFTETERRWAAELSELSGQRKALHGITEGLGELKSCVLTPKFGVEIPCHSLVEIGAAKTSIEGQVETLKSQEKEKSAALSQLREETGVIRTQLEDQKRLLNDKEQMDAGVRAGKTKMIALNKELGELEEAGALSEIVSDNARLEELERTVRVADMRLQAHTTTKKWEKNKKIYEFLTTIIRLFEPDGIQSRLLEEKMKTLNEVLKRGSTVVFGGESCLQVSLGEKVGLELVDGNGKRIPLELFSGSQKFRAQVLLQAALAEIGGTKLLLIDGLDVLDSERREWLVQYLEEIGHKFDQIIASCTAIYEIPGKSEYEGVDFWLVHRPDKYGTQIQLIA